MNNVDILLFNRGRRGCDRMVVGLTTTCAIRAYHHQRCEFESRSWRGVLDTTLCDKVCHLKVALNIIHQTKQTIM
jgi:hypothetical protein